MAKRRCPKCEGTGWLNLRPVGIPPEAYDEAIDHLVREGGGRPCRQEHCGGHLEQSEVKMLTGWNGIKLVTIRERLMQDKVLMVTLLRGKAGRPRLLWHLTGNKTYKELVRRMEYTLEETLGGD